MGCFQDRKVVQLLMFVSSVHFSFGVAASPSDRLWGELETIKTKLTQVLEEQATLHTLYSHRIEPHIVSVANLIGSLDSNVKNLQERAHVWDTFQHHVSAWNEQIHIIDNKLTILSRGQEKVDSLVNNMNSVFNLEYKANLILTNVEENGNKLVSLIKLVEDREKKRPLVEEFATRGVLSTLKTIEQKVDRLNTVFQSDIKIRGSRRFTSNRKNETEDFIGKRSKFFIRCQFPPLLEETLQDISAKTDIIFDKISQSVLDPESDYNISLATDNKSASSVDSRIDEEFASLSEDKLIKKLIIEVVSSQNSTLDAFKKFSLDYMQNFTDSLHHIEYCCKTATHVNMNVSNGVQNMFMRLDKIESLIENQDICYTDNLRSFLTEERAHLESFLLHKVSLCEKTSSMTSYKNRSETYINGCDGVETNVSTVYQLGPKELNDAGRDFYQRYCDYENEYTGWTIIQRRGPYGDMKENFNRSWAEYKNGFGSLEGEFWFGNDYIHRLTTEQDVVLHIILEDFEGNQAWAQYTTFRVLQESDSYRLEVGGYSGNASDSLTAHNNFQFSTIDRNNDIAPSCCPCAPAYGGGWWYYSCFESNLNGMYQEEAAQNVYFPFQGIIWEHWRGNYSLKRAVMKIKPKSAMNTHTPEEHDTTTPFIYEDP